MRILRPIFLACALSICSMSMVSADFTGGWSEARAAGPQSVADLAEGLLPAVVNISTSQTIKRPSGARRVPRPRVPDGSPFQEFFDDFFKEPGGPEGQPGPRTRKVQSLGSGFVIDPSGIVITNNHVIEGADEITVNFPDGTKLKAKLIGTDKKTDIAVLQIKPKKPLKSVKFGDSRKSRIGDWVMAIGNPFGLGGTVTLGIISAINRDIRSGPYDNFIQTDASINRGNSGGPLFNMDGDVIGINTAIISPSGGSIGIGFSIPADLAQSVISQLREFGETRRGWLGVRIQPVTDDISESIGMTGTQGALVAGVTNNGPADKSKIQPGDVILRFDGRPIVKMRDLPRIVADSPVGKAVDVIVMRNGEEKTIPVVLGRLEDGEKIAANERTGNEPDKNTKTPSKILGMELGDLSEQVRKQFKISDDVQGVVITQIDPNSSAAEKGVRVGDVISEIAQESVKSVEDVSKQIAALKKQGRQNALLLIASSNGELRFAVIRIE